MVTTYRLHNLVTFTARPFKTEAAAIAAADRLNGGGSYIIQTRTDRQGRSSHTIVYRTGAAIAA